MKKTLATLLVVVLLALPLAGCYNPSTVLTISGMDIPSGLYLYFQLQAVSEASAKFENEHTGSELYKQTIDDIPARDWINNRTIEIAQEYVFVEQEFVRLGVDEDAFNTEMSLYDSSLKSQWSQQSYFYERNGIGYDSFYKAYEYYVKSSSVFDALYIADTAEFPVPETEIKDYFVENYAYLDIIKISLTDADGDPLADGRKTTLRNLATEMKEYAETAVEDLDQVFQDNGNAGLNAALDLYASRESISDADLESAKSSMLVTDVIVKPDSTSYDENLLAALFASPAESYNIYESDDTLYLYCKRAILDYDPDKWDEYSGSIIATIRADEFSDYLIEKSKTLDVTENARARKRFSLDNVNMN